MGIKWNRTKVSIKPETCIVAALALFLIPWQWVFAWVISSAFHELCHYIAIKLCRCRIWSIDIGIRGTLMETENLTCFQEGVCALAGPVGSLLLTFTSFFMPRVAICGLFHFLYNLLPVYPLDGGRALQALLGHILPDALAETWVKIIGNSVVILLVLLAIYGYRHLALGQLPLMIAAFLVLKIKIPCKQRQLRVQ